MTREIHDQTLAKMKKTTNILRKELGTLRAGRATPTLLDKIQVDYYGTPTPLNQLASITTPEPRLLLIQPWDKGVSGDIEKAILKSDLGLTPASDGNVIRLVIPQLTEERRRELVRIVRKKAEEAKVAIRNLRREANEQLKKAEKNGDLSQDRLRKETDEIQKLTDEYIKEVDAVFSEKEREIMEI